MTHPDRLYLQLEDTFWFDEVVSTELDTFSVDRQDLTDIEYVRGDLLDAARAELAAVKAILSETQKEIIKGTMCKTIKVTFNDGTSQAVADELAEKIAAWTEQANTIVAIEVSDEDNE